MSAKSNLSIYKKRRDFTSSPEPAGASKRRQSKKTIFVVQKHAASHLHYDLRLEIGGVLVSWAVPKGISKSTAIKRLAIRTDDHPMDYATFEGEIPAGNYGAGTVEIWDHGTYLNSKEKDGSLMPMKQCLKNGQIEVSFMGKKLKGAYALHRFKDEKDQWLLVKMKDNKKSEG